MNKNILIGLAALVIIAGGYAAIADPTMEWIGQGTPNSAEDAPSGSIHNLPVPAGVAAAKKAAALEAGVAESKVLILTAFEREWPNGCLGLAAEGEMCTEAIVPGFEVTLEINGEVSVYRTSEDGTVVRKEK